ncbi:MAG: hypothetical protein WA867_02855, partial [Candidatus Acidiferrales bacterium]
GPRDCPPRRLAGGPRDDDNIVALGLKVPSNKRSYLTGPARQHDSHRPTMHAPHYDIHRGADR